MSEENTHKWTPFEILVLKRFDQIDAHLSSTDARLDAMDARLDSMDVRLQVLDSMDARLEALEKKGYDTKPIWEEALAEILEVKA